MMEEQTYEIILEPEEKKKVVIGPLTEKDLLGLICAAATIVRLEDSWQAIALEDGGLLGIYQKDEEK